MICLAYDDNALDVRTCRNWFARFKSGDFDLNDKDCSGKPIEVNGSVLEELFKEERRQTNI